MSDFKTLNSFLALDMFTKRVVRLLRLTIEVPESVVDVLHSSDAFVVPLDNTRTVLNGLAELASAFGHE